MRVVFAGTPEVALPTLVALAASGHQLIAVLTRPDAPSGRGRQLSRSPVATWADGAGVPVLQPARLSAPGALAELERLAPDCCPVVAYGALLPKAALDLPARGWVNLHYSLLPAWRGAAPVQRAVMAGDQVIGASTFAIEEGLDTGPIYGVLTEAVRPTDTAGDLLTRLSHSGAGLLVATLDGIEAGTLQPVPQPTEGVSLAPKITVAEARVDWRLPAFAVDRRLRGVTPEPGGWTMLRGERVKLAPVLVNNAVCDPDDGRAGGVVLAPGELLVRKRDVLVGTATEPVTLTRVQAQGKREMAAVEWARGLRPVPAEAFE
ncbi:MAG TPA: methionyl-tRNA formyltransferase [Kineosporiaceae bacterium]|nr:methionyl-tRNA formyltransferase [Kineosporiaceae bacterium]